MFTDPPYAPTMLRATLSSIPSPPAVAEKYM